MRCANEPIARAANREDACTGRFWEGRFRCQALLDEKALAACMTYVDLNPVRAGESPTPEASAFTSLHLRLRQASRATQPEGNRRRSIPLMPFAGAFGSQAGPCLPFGLSDYLTLVDWTGRSLVEGKSGAIPDGVAPILERLGMAPASWIQASGQFELHFQALVGDTAALRSACRTLGYRRTPGVTVCARLLASARAGARTPDAIPEIAADRA